ncbi:MAG: hypothetical protein EPO24_10215, partial [Bacteroidetes bacterium]
MKRVTVRFMSIPMYLLLVLSSVSLFAQYNVRVKFPITVTANGGAFSNTLQFGFAPEAGYCVDSTHVPFAECDSALEMYLPPPPPGGILDARWVDSRSGSGACLDQGISDNFHQAVSESQVDTFRLQFQPSSTGYPITISWLPGMGAYCDSMKLRKTSTVFIDMLAQTFTIISAADEINRVSIIVYGLRGVQEAPPIPVLLQPSDGDTGLGGSAIFSWEAVTFDSDIQYRFEVSEDSLFSLLHYEGVSNTTSMNVSGFTKDTKYFWRVKAISSLEGCYQDVPYSFRTAPEFDTITVIQGTNGVISPGTIVVSRGSDTTFTITPTTGYHIDSVFVDDVYVGAVASYDFTNTSSNHTLTAKFAINTYTLTITPPVHGTITLNPDLSLYNHGTIVEITAVPDTIYVFDGWGGDVSGTTNPLFLTMDGDKVVAGSFIDSRDTAYLRTSTMEQWALAQDTKGKYVSNKKKFDRVFFKFTLVADSTGILSLDFMGTVSTGAITRGATTLDTLATFDNVKKLKDTLVVTLGDIVTIEGMGNVGKWIKVKYAWGAKGKFAYVTGYLKNVRGLPMPNLHNVGEEMFKQNAFPTGLVVGIPQGTKKANSVIHKKYADVQKSLLKIQKFAPLLHTQGPRCLDSIGTKIFIPQKLSLPPNTSKQNNKLFAEQLTLKLNVAASATKKFPLGLDELMYFDVSDSSNP